MLSSGYLQPFHSVQRSVEDERESVALFAREQQKLASKSRTSYKEVNSTFSGISSVRAGLIFERLHGEYQMGEDRAGSLNEELPASVKLDPMEVYRRYASIRGLWTLSRGFEPVLKMVIEPSFDLAA